MRTAPEPRRPRPHRNSLAVLKAVGDWLDCYARSRGNGCLRLEINFHQGVPARLTRCQETRQDIPLEDA